jgi:hypothetical protein
MIGNESGVSIKTHRRVRMSQDQPFDQRLGCGIGYRRF